MIKYPAKIFPCERTKRGLVARKDKKTEDYVNGPFIEIGFWQFGHNRDKWSWREVIRACWYIIRKRTFWTDMIIMNSKVAKNFAYHILYLLDKDKVRKQQQEPLVRESEDNHELDKHIKFDL